MDSFEVFLLILYILSGPILLFLAIRSIIVLNRRWFHTYSCVGTLKDKRVDESRYSTMRGSTNSIIRYVAEINVDDGSTKIIGVDLLIYDDLVVGDYCEFEIISGQLKEYAKIS